MKIAVCGCSFSSPVGGQFKGTHWAEMLAQELDAELIVFARQGISNNAIRLQINEAIKHEPDYVIINATTPDRIEIPVDARDNRGREKYVGCEGMYNPKKGLQNLNYPGNDYGLISETIFSIIDWPEHPYRNRKIDPDTKFATKLYASFIYDSWWKSQCDSWVLNSGLWHLHNQRIKFLYNPWLLRSDLLDIPEWFIQKYCIHSQMNLIDLSFRFKPEIDPGYHTTDQGQIFIKDEYFKFIISSLS